MGTEGIWVPLVLAAVSGTAQYINQRNVAHRQDQALAAQIRAQQAKQHEADAKTAELIAKEGKSTDTQDKAKSLAAYDQQLALKQPQATNVLKVPGAVSAAYKKAGSDTALGITGYGQNIADLTSSIDAPTQQRQRDIIENIDPYRQDIGLIARRNAGDTFLSNMKLRGIQGNPWLSLVSGVAGAGAKAYSGGADAGGEDWLNALYKPYQKPIPGAWDGGGDYSGYS